MRLPRFLYPLTRRRLVRGQVDQMEPRSLVEVFHKKKELEEKMAEHMRKAQRFGQTQKHLAEIEEAKLELLNWLYYGRTD